MEARAQIKYVRMSPLKLRTLVTAVKSMSPQGALDSLGLSKTRNAKYLYKALKSAVSNGQNMQGFDISKAKIKVLKVDEGPVFKRFRAGSKGSPKPYIRKSSHITVVIEHKEVVQKAEPVKKVEEPKKIEEKTTEKVVEKKVEAKKVTKKVTQK